MPKLGGTCKKIFSALTRRFRPPQTWLDGYAPEQLVTVDTVANSVDIVANSVDSVADTVDSVADKVDSVADKVDSVADTVDSVADTVDSVAHKVDSVADTVDSVARMSNVLQLCHQCVRGQSDTVDFSVEFNFLYWA